MNKTTIMFLISCLVLLVGICLNVHASTWAKVQGSVKGPDGKPIKDAKIELISQEGEKSEIKTDDKGKWIAANLSPGDWKIQISASGYQSQSMQATLTAIRDNKPIDVVLTKTQKSILQKGNELYQMGKYQEAIKAYEQVLVENPNFYAVYEQIGMCYFRLNDMENAVKTLKLLLEKSPGDEKALITLSTIYLDSKQLQEALTYFKLLKEDNVKDPNVFYNFGILYFKENQMDTAIEFLNKCIQRDSNYYKAYYQLGLVYVNKGNMDEAKKNFQKVVELNAESEEAKLARGMLDSF
jgi:tetratricopeptide (TPR) repeat protein